MRVKYDLLSMTIGKNLVFNKPKECIQKSKFNDSKCYHGYILVHNAISLQAINSTIIMRLYITIIN
jgi:hypothetical protein